MLKTPSSKLNEGVFDSFISLKLTQALFDVDANLWHIHQINH